MPNSDKANNDFYSFVSTYFSNDPYLMLERFESDIAIVANDVSINWYESKVNVDLLGTKISGKHVVGNEKADSGRMWINGFENIYDAEFNGATEKVKYPIIRFQNFRKHFPEPVYFNGLDLLWKEFDRYRKGERINRCVINLDAKKDHLDKQKLMQDEVVKLREQAINKDENWIRYLVKRTFPCPYFESKGVGELYLYKPLYVGNTTLGSNVGEFTAICLEDVKTGCFRGLQRIYPNSGAKVFRKGLDPTGAVYTVGTAVNGEAIYVFEAPADAGMSYKLTSCFSIAALYADNISSISFILRQKYPDSPLIFVADNDQYGGANKGVDVCEKALRSTDGDTYMLIPTFKESEKKARKKDLTDYCQAYGDEQGKVFLLSYC